jgi:hypothetical protein
MEVLELEDTPLTAKNEEVSTLCAFPWTHLYIDNVGTLTTCCIGDPRPHTDENGEMICAGQKDAILRHWRSPRMRSVRRDLVSGKRHPVCKACWRMEDLGSYSYRHRANEMPFEAYVVDEEVPSPRLQFIDLRLGNYCNLKCRMCTPYTSRLLIPEYLELQVRDEEYWENLAHLKWFESDAFWDDLLQYASDFRHVHLAGGEPMMIKKAWDFLYRLVDLGYSESIELSYNTNWTIIPRLAREIWPKFKSVHLFISMDGVGKVNEFIRYPSNWNKFCDNLYLLESEHENLNVQKAIIHSTAQIYNVFNLPEICEFVKSLHFIEPYPEIDLVVHPEVFDIRVLPSDMKDNAMRRIMTYIDTIKGDIAATSLCQRLYAVVEHMETGDHTHLIPELRHYNEVYDRYRKQSTVDILPELATLFG